MQSDRAKEPEDVDSSKNRAKEGEGTGRGSQWFPAMRPVGGRGGGGLSSSEDGGVTMGPRFLAWLMLWEGVGFLQ